MLNYFADDLIRNTRQNLLGAKVNSVDEVREVSERLVTFSAPADLERRRAKEFLYANLYFSPALSAEKEDAERVITELFSYWVAKPEALPASYQEKSRREPLPQVVCDCIAGMTDNFIYEQHRKHCGAE